MEGKGDIVPETTHPDDLLTLIGRAIDHLRSSIELFEVEDRQAGIEELSTVIRDIESYVEHVEADPLLSLATLPTVRVRDGLLTVTEDLAIVIRQFENAPS